MRNDSEVFTPRKNEAEAVELLNTLATMTKEDQRQMLAFLSGVSLGRQLSAGPAA